MQQVATHTDYSLLNQLTPDPQARTNGEHHDPREVF